MQYTTLGHTDIKISQICLGTMTWGSQNTESDGHAQMDFALENGVNFWDTAEMYATPPTAKTYGTTEAIIGTWLAKRKRRSDIILATKITPELGHIRGGNSPIDRKNLIEALDESLKRLQTDYVDLYQLHWPTNRPTYHFNRSWSFSANPQSKAAIIENQLESLETLDEFIKQGKVRAIGLSNDSAWGVTSFAGLAEKHNLPKIASLQNEYSLLRRRDDTDVAEACMIEDVSYLSWSPLAMGIISGKYLKGASPKNTRFSPEEAASSRYGYRLNNKVEKAVDGYVEIAKKYDLDPCQMALAFLLSRPFITSPIVGASSVKQLENNFKAIDLTLSKDLLREIDDVHRDYPAPF